jgi:D-glycero-alpha-D-manno-heptose-7-phosphate kinase
MIITQTPLRISLAGGGTDVEDFYSLEGGCVISSAIDKYIYVIVKERFDDMIYVNYSKKEIVDRVEDIQHDLVREVMKKTGVTKGVEITTLADVPSEGTGLGSSSSVTVGLLNALYIYQGEQMTLETLASEACEIEIDRIKKPIGKQDQYIAAYGNLRLFRFEKDGVVTIEKMKSPESTRRRLSSNLLLFYTNRTRSADTLLVEQKKNLKENIEYLREIKKYVEVLKEILLANELDEVGRVLHETWILKKQLANSISDKELDKIYETALQSGALGGKVTGAGGGGFFLFYCPREHQDSLRTALHKLQELRFHLEIDGSKAIFNHRRHGLKE